MQVQLMRRQNAGGGNERHRATDRVRGPILSTSKAGGGLRLRHLPPLQRRAITISLLTGADQATRDGRRLNCSAPRSNTAARMRWW